MPTEAEWEYAARAGTTTAYSYGSDAGLLGSYAWYDDNSGGETHEVGERNPNPWGLYDMHGNVEEWCQDWYDWYGDYPNSSVTDPTGPTTGSYRVHRGGGWCIFAERCRSAARKNNSPDYRPDWFGFRVLAVRRPGQ